MLEADARAPPHLADPCPPTVALPSLPSPPPSDAPPATLTASTPSLSPEASDSPSFRPSGAMPSSDGGSSDVGWSEGHACGEGEEEEGPGGLVSPAGAVLAKVAAPPKLKKRPAGDGDGRWAAKKAAPGGTKAAPQPPAAAPAPKGTPAKPKVAGQPPKAKSPPTSRPAAALAAPPCTAPPTAPASTAVSPSPPLRLTRAKPPSPPAPHALALGGTSARFRLAGLRRKGFPPLHPGAGQKAGE